MPNLKYKRGRAKEYRIKNSLEKQGLIVLRTAGSHGFADLIAIDKENKEIIFIQAKSKKEKERIKNKLETEYQWINQPFLVRFQVV